MTSATGAIGADSPDPDVVAAVISVVVPSSGLAIYYISRDSLSNLPIWFASLGIFLFCIAIFSGIGLSKEVRDKKAIRDISTSKLYLTQKEKYLSNCSRQEQLLNQVRQSLNLSPLASEYFCKPDEIISNFKFFLAQKERYLLHCSFQEQRINQERKNKKLSPLASEYFCKPDEILAEF